MERGENSRSSRQHNRGLVLQLIVTGSCKTRTELTQRTKLTKMTVSNIINEMIDRRILEEYEEEQTEKRGRNPIVLRLSPEAPKMVGVLIFRDRIEAVLCDLSLNILNKCGISFSDLTENMMFQYTYHVIDKLLKIEENILGIGVTTIGPVDVNAGKMLNPPRFFGIENVPILSMLKERYPYYPIYYDGDNNSAAIAERYFGVGRDYQDFIFLGISNGVGSSIVSQGKVFHNKNGLTSEIGHISIDPKGILCECGNRGCLEKYVSSYIVLEKLRKVTGEEKSFQEFCKYMGNPEVDAVFTEMMEEICIALISSVNILQPELIVMGHDSVYLQQKYIQMLEDKVNDYKLVKNGKRVLVKKAYFGKMAQLVGAAANLSDRLFNGEILF